MRRLKKMLSLCPLLLLVVAVYFAVVPFGGVEVLMGNLISLEVGSRADITVSDTLITLGLILLYFEISKSTSSDKTVNIEHIFSLMLFIGCLLAFLGLEICGNSTFFLIMVMTLLDVVAGFTVSIASSRRDVTLGT